MQSAPPAVAGPAQTRPQDFAWNIACVTTQLTLHAALKVPNFVDEVAGERVEQLAEWAAFLPCAVLGVGAGALALPFGDSFERGVGVGATLGWATTQCVIETGFRATVISLSVAAVMTSLSVGACAGGLAFAASTAVHAGRCVVPIPWHARRNT